MCGCECDVWMWMWCVYVNVMCMWCVHVMCVCDVCMWVCVCECDVYVMECVNVYMCICIRVYMWTPVISAMHQKKLLTQATFPNVDQHVCIGAAPDTPSILQVSTHTHTIHWNTFNNQHLATYITATKVGFYCIFSWALGTHTHTHTHTHVWLFKSHCLQQLIIFI